MGSGGLCGLPGPGYEPGEWESQLSLGPSLWQPVLTLQHAWSRQQLGQEEVVSECWSWDAGGDCILSWAFWLLPPLLVGPAH